MHGRDLEQAVELDGRPKAGNGRRAPRSARGLPLISGSGLGGFPSAAMSYEGEDDQDPESYVSQ
jgi:hypothetical protein